MEEAGWVPDPPGHCVDKYFAAAPFFMLKQDADRTFVQMVGHVTADNTVIYKTLDMSVAAAFL